VIFMKVNEETKMTLLAMLCLAMSGAVLVSVFVFRPPLPSYEVEAAVLGYPTINGSVLTATVENLGYLNHTLVLCNATICVGDDRYCAASISPTVIPVGTETVTIVFAGEPPVKANSSYPVLLLTDQGTVRFTTVCQQSEVA